MCVFFFNPLIISVYCGERGIRTPGTSQFNGFQDRRDRPLCHLSNDIAFSKSGAKIMLLFVTGKLNDDFVVKI